MAGLALGSLLIGGLIPALRASINASFAAKRGCLSAITQFRTSARLQQAMDSLDSHRLDIPPRVHRQGRIAFTDGDPNPVVNLRTRNAPHPEADAISSLTLDLPALHDVFSLTGASPGAVFAACPRYGGPFSASSYEGYVGLSADGLLALTGRAAAHPGRPGCRDFALTPAKSMTISPAPPERILLVRSIVPITAEYTLYLDLQNQLRYLAHSAADNIENQPMLSNLAGLKLELVRLADHGLYAMEGWLQPAHGPAAGFSLVNRLSRVSGAGLLLGQP